MTTSRSNIEGWIGEAQKAGATHLIIACDTFDWEDYPVNVMPGQDVHILYTKYNGPNMQKVMEVYNLGKDINKQLEEHRSLNF